MFRFYVSYGLACTTTRGPTQMNGAQSHCGKCQAAHAAITPHLLDNTFYLARNYLVTSPYNQLSPIKQMLVSRCLRLTPSNIESLNDTSKTHREQFLQQHTHHSFHRLKAGLFPFNSIGFMYNSTFEGPTAGNRIDCHLESILRPIEDELAIKCTNSALSPKEALEQFHSKYKAALEALEKHLEQVLPAMNALQNAKEAMEKAEGSLLVSRGAATQDLQIHISNYKQALAHYLACFDRFFQLSGSGVPKKNHKQIIDALKIYYPLFTLKNINQFLGNSSYQGFNLHSIFNIHLDGLVKIREKAELLPDSKKIPEWATLKREIDLRQDEVVHQKHILSLGFQEIYELAKMEISSQDATGKWISPSRPAIASALISRAESPIAPPRKRARLTELESDCKTYMNVLENSKATADVAEKAESCDTPKTES